jgi:N-dimethylarginine dimethylaminohydrolase
MALTQEEKDKIAEWCRSKGIENCVACGFSGEMRYGDVVTLPVVGFGGQTVIVGSGERTVISSGQTVISGSGGGRVVVDGEEVGPVGGVVPIACSNCGYTMLFSEEVLPL